MAKAKPQAQQRQRGRPAQRVDSERLNRLLIVGGVAAVIVIAIGVIAFGWYQTRIKPLGKTVLQVGEEKFSLGHLERRMELELSENPGIYQSEGVLALPDRVLNVLEFEGLLLAGAGQLDITVTEEDIDADIRQRGGLEDDATATQIARAFRNQVDESGLHADEYRQMLRAELLHERVLNYFVFLSPSQEAQVRSRWIVVQTREEADEVVRRLDAGDDFTALVEEFSVAGTNEEEGGVVDWSPRGAFPGEEVETFLFDEAEPGTRSDVIATENFFYIVELLERDPARTLEESQRQVVGNRGLSDWLDTVKEGIAVVEDFSDEDANRAINDVI